MIEGLRSIRALPKESLRGVEPSKTPGKKPRFEWVDPSTLFVEEAYQRDFAENGTRMVRKIIGGYSWSRFKPPVCVRDSDSNVLVVIDGQHTAIASASHPDIDKIPVMIVDAADVAARAGAFVGHNRDRIALTQMAIYHGELASGDEVARIMDRACKAAGASILTKSINLRSAAPVGSTIAVGTIRALARTKGERFLTRVLAILVKSKRGPIKAEEIAAVSAVMSVDPDDETVDRRLLDVAKSKTAEQWSAIAATLAAESGKPGSTELGLFWATALGLGVEASPSVKTSSISSASKAVARPQLRKVPRPAPTEPPRTPSPAKPAAPIVVPRQPEETVLMDGKSPESRMWGPWNGVTIDLRDRRVIHRRSEVVVSDDGIRMIAALARVMPALLPSETLAKKTFGKVAEAEFNVRGLVLRLNPVVAAARLEVRTVGKMGYMLADLGV